jgi:hypothetical protein
VLGSAPVTSASPPVLANGTASLVTKRMFTRALSLAAVALLPAASAQPIQSPQAFQIAPLPHRSRRGQAADCSYPQATTATHKMKTERELRSYAAGQTAADDCPQHLLKHRSPRRPGGLHGSPDGRRAASGG